jgi:GNAT superfamily N-acetyltransferase
MLWQVRTLKDDAEVEGWLDFVVSCFAFKGVERSHFATHFHSDPWRDAALVVVAETTSAANEPPQFVATLRIFDRRLYAKDGSMIRVGGIGEVCTREDWRRKGLCRELLNHASQLMRVKT